METPPLYLTARRTSTADNGNGHGGKVMVTTHLEHFANTCI